MRTVFISHLNHSQTKRTILGKLVTDYDTQEGIIREICPKSGNRPPKYKIKRTREPINVIII